MKKFLFSAIALTAFSFSTMANNEVKEEANEEVVGTNCSSYALASTLAESNYYGEVMSQEEFAEAYTFYYNTCVWANNNNSSLKDPIVG